MLRKLAIPATASLLAVAALGVSSKASEPTVITNIAPAQLDWEKTEEGVAFAPLVGKRFEEPYMAMVQLPAGLVSPAHTKSSNMFGVVLSGTFVHVSAEAGSGDEVLLPVGSFYKIPANVPHISKCVSDTDCVTFLYQDGKFDFLPISQ